MFCTYESGEMEENNICEQRNSIIDPLRPVPHTNEIVAHTDRTGERRNHLSQWLGKTFRIVITDGRVLVGFFNCTDKDANVVLSMCAEYLEEGKDARFLGNVMIPGKHIVSISVDMPSEEKSSVQPHVKGSVIGPQKC